MLPIQVTLAAEDLNYLLNVANLVNLDHSAHTEVVAIVRDHVLAALEMYFDHSPRRISWAHGVAQEAAIEAISLALISVGGDTEEWTSSTDEDAIVQSSFEAGYVTAIEDLCSGKIALPRELVNRVSMGTDSASNLI